MEIPKPPIQFYRIRTFGEKLNASFDFLRENLKPLLRFSLYLILPLCLVQSFFMDSFMRSYMGMINIKVDGGMTFSVIALVVQYVLLLLCVVAGSIIMSGLIYSLMQTYRTRPGRLKGIRFDDFRTLFLQNCVRSGRIFLFTFCMMIAIVGVVLLLVLLSPWTLAVTLPLLLAGTIAFAVPLSLFTPVYLFEPLTFRAALRKAVKYGFSAWGEIFLVMLVFGLLANVVSGITTTPWYIVTVIGSLFSTLDPESAFASSVWYRFGTYLLGIVMAYGTYVSMMISVTGLAFQYFHLREKKEGVTMRTDIANFDRL
jgi:hypothetical protein